MKRFICFLAVTALLLAFTHALFAYTIPEYDSKAKYFYVFGPQGDPDMGAE